MTNPIEEYISISESRSVRILLWILKNRDSDNRIHSTLDTIAEECKVTKVTVNRIFQRLYKNGFLTKIRNGQYQLHKI